MRGCAFYFFLIVMCNLVVAQQVTINSNQSPEALVQDVLVRGCIGVRNMESPVNGNAFGFPSFGSFTRGNSNFPFEEGIVLSTGNVNSIGNGRIETTLNEGANEWGSDPDLEQSLQIQNTLNATTIAFDFVAISDRISFNYVFASEEYEGVFSCDELNADSFVFLIKPTGTNEAYRNIAVVPGTSTPVNTNTVRPEIEGFCTASNDGYFAGYHLGATNFNGRTEVMTATATIVPNTSYHVKLIIADRSDRFYDSAVFIEAKSFSVPFDIGENIETCASSVTLFADVGNSQAQYGWYLNGQHLTTTHETSIEVFESGEYTVRAEVPVGNSSCVIEDSVSVLLQTEMEFQNQITDYVLCDLQNSGDLVEVFDLESKNTEVLNALSPGDYKISYHISDADAQNNSNSIVGPFVNTSSLQELFIRAENQDTGCLAFSSFQIEVQPMFSYTAPSPVNACTESNAAIAIVDFEETTTQIKAGNSSLMVNYYATEIDALQDANPLSLPLSLNSTVTSVFIRIEQPGTECFETTQVPVSILQSPVIRTGDYYIDACDANANGFAIFDLTSLENEIGGGSNVIYTYYRTQLNAASGEDPINAPQNFQNEIPFEQTVYVRVTNTETGCYSTEEIELHTEYLLTGTSIQEVVAACDDASSDGKEEFNLQNIEALFIGDEPNMSIDFYHNESERDARINSIDKTVPFENTMNPQELFFVIRNEVCESEASFELLVTPYFQLETPVKQFYCDEDTDRRTQINLSQFNNAVTNNQPQFTVLYFLTASDAANNQNAIPESYTNTTDSFVLYARVTNLNGCVYVNSIEIEVLPAPEVNALTDVIYCDDDSTIDGKIVVDLSAKRDEVTDDPNMEVELYTSFELATARSNPISDVSNFEITTQTIYVRVTNPETSCFQITGFNSTVNTLPVFSEEENLYYYLYCEEDRDQTGEFTLASRDDIVLNGQLNKEVSYHHTGTNAHLGVAEIDKYSPFRNTSNPQQLFVRVQNSTDPSCYAVHPFELRVETYPVYTAPNVLPVCDDEIPDGYINFDFASVRAQLLEGSLEEQGLAVTFHSSLVNANNKLNPLADNYVNQSNPQRIYARIETSEGCFAIESFYIRVFQRPALLEFLPIEVCDTDYDGQTTIVLNDYPLQSYFLDVRNNYQLQYYRTQEDFVNGIGVLTNFELASEIEISNETRFFVKVIDPNTYCYSQLILSFRINLPPAYVPLEKYEFCQTENSQVDLSAISSLLNPEDNTEISYFTNQSDAESNTNGTSQLYTYSNFEERIYFRITDLDEGCFIVDAFDLVINPKPRIPTLIPLEACEDIAGTGMANVDLKVAKDLEILHGRTAEDYHISYHISEEDAINANQAIDANYQVSDAQTIWYRITDVGTSENTTCYAIGSFTNRVHELPVIENIPDTVALCLTGSLTLTANASDSDLYQWYLDNTPLPLGTNQEITVTEPGNYKIEVLSENGCISTKDFTVSQASFIRVDVTHFRHPNEVTVLISGDGVYQYELEELGVQDDNTFVEVPVGVYAINVYQDACEIFRTPEFYVMNYPRFFTPNGDGINDRWHILGIDSSDDIESAEVRIYDRYGNFIARITESTLGWDGRDADGNNMPENDYWFAIDVTINKQHLVVRGHFSLLR